MMSILPMCQWQIDPLIIYSVFNDSSIDNDGKHIIEIFIIDSDIVIIEEMQWYSVKRNDPLILLSMILNQW